MTTTMTVETEMANRHRHQEAPMRQEADPPSARLSNDHRMQVVAVLAPPKQVPAKVTTTASAHERQKHAHMLQVKHRTNKSLEMSC